MKQVSALLIIGLLLSAVGCGAVGRSLGKAASRGGSTAGKAGAKALRNSAKAAPAAIPFADDTMRSGRRAFSSSDELGSGARRATSESGSGIRDSAQTAGELGLEAAMSGDDDR